MIQIVFALILGLAVGAVIVWLLLRLQAQRAVEECRGAALAERGTLAERLAAKDKEIAQLSTAGESQTKEISGLRSELTAQSERRAIAEEKNNRIPKLDEELTQKNWLIDGLRGEANNLKITLEKERTDAEGKLAYLNEAQQKLSDAFKALSADALKSNNESFLSLAKSTLDRFQQGAQSDLAERQKAIDALVKPLAASLLNVDVKIAEIEKSRTTAYATLTEQVKSLATTQGQLHAETGNLVRALRAPQVRGRWGEIQLKRVVELAGMVEHCDFKTQVSATTEDGRLRPDLVIRLPGNKNVVVDAKCPLMAYLDALTAPDEASRLAHLKNHARQVSDHMSKLAAKGYWEQFSPTPEFVFLFLPGEMFFSAALEQDPSLIEMGVNKQVILATPTILIALLRAVAYGWSQEQIAQNYQAIGKLGRDLYDRIRTLAENFGRVGASLDSAVENYNKAVGTLEGRVLVSARKFKELQPGTDREIELLEAVEKKARVIQTSELAVLPAPE